MDRGSGRQTDGRFRVSVAHELLLTAWISRAEAPEEQSP
jgi:hypothetical protein